MSRGIGTPMNHSKTYPMPPFCVPDSEPVGRSLTPMVSPPLLVSRPNETSPSQRRRVTLLRGMWTGCDVLGMGNSPDRRKSSPFESGLCHAKEVTCVVFDRHVANVVQVSGRRDLSEVLSPRQV